VVPRLFLLASSFFFFFRPHIYSGTLLGAACFSSFFCAAFYFSQRVPFLYVYLADFSKVINAFCHEDRVPCSFRNFCAVFPGILNVTLNSLIGFLLSLSLRPSLPRHFPDVTSAEFVIDRPYSTRNFWIETIRRFFLDHPLVPRPPLFPRVPSSLIDGGGIRVRTRESPCFLKTTRSSTARVCREKVLFARFNHISRVPLFFSFRD